eukprot:GHVU01159957.1.p1 GENE.GHVU01159957.1~~GHVU01159957.1.p1  ORF type:complete len:625 (+),score=154.53 GHVU01159957.1:1379-3253(+)
MFYCLLIVSEGERLGKEGEAGGNNLDLTIAMLGRTGHGKTTCAKALKCGLLYEKLEDCVDMNFDLDTTEYDIETKRFIEKGQVGIRQVHGHLADTATVRVHQYKDADGRSICRLVDTPGFLDNREGQRNVNRDSIAEGLTALGEVNAILAFFSATEPRLTDEVNSVVEELMKTCGKAALERLIFVFTKAPLDEDIEDYSGRNSVGAALLKKGIEIEMKVMGENEDEGNVVYINNDILKIEGRAGEIMSGSNQSRKDNLAASFEMGPRRLRRVVEMVKKSMSTPISTNVAERVNWVRNVMEAIPDNVKSSLMKMKMKGNELKELDDKCRSIQKDVKTYEGRLKLLNEEKEGKEKEVGEARDRLEKLSMHLNVTESSALTDAKRRAEEAAEKAKTAARTGKKKNFNDGEYQGELVDGKQEGYGVYKWKDGRVYEGEWRDGERTGYGILRDADGTVGRGEWRNDEPEGCGELRLKNDTVYEGEWRIDGEMECYGVLREDGDVYEGQLKGGKEGWGMMRYANGTEKAGWWENDELKRSDPNRAKQGVAALKRDMETRYEVRKKERERDIEEPKRKADEESARELEAVRKEQENANADAEMGAVTDAIRRAEEAAVRAKTAADRGEKIE